MCDLLILSCGNRPELLVVLFDTVIIVVLRLFLVVLLGLFDLDVIVNIHFNLNLFVILRQRVTHVAFELRNGEVELKLAVWQEVLDHTLSESSNERPLIVRDDFIEVLFDKLGLEICQVEATIIVRGELVGDIEHYLV